uniref:Ovule protein n=1 Tax=Mesocestoides corti TaxID=53468 RepID=A0A5K3G1W2_MESCO
MRRQSKPTCLFNNPSTHRITRPQLIRFPCNYFQIATCFVHPLPTTIPACHPSIPATHPHTPPYSTFKPHHRRTQRRRSRGRSRSQKRIIKQGYSALRCHSLTTDINTQLNTLYHGTLLDSTAQPSLSIIIG